jgi:TRAP-type C4-dicarboxylate transport system permease small subunit
MNILKAITVVVTFLLFALCAAMLSVVLWKYVLGIKGDWFTAVHNIGMAVLGFIMVRRIVDNFDERHSCISPHS